ncbi:hypothetical protein JCM5353_004345 [Sporobolomyces roseus]
MADHPLHRSRSHEDSDRLSERTVGNLEHYYEGVESLSVLDLDHAKDLIAEEDQRTGADNRDKLVDILKRIIRDRSATAQSRDLLLGWARSVRDKLDTPHRPGWNYYYMPNYRKIDEYFEELRAARDSRGQPVVIARGDEIVGDYKVERIVRKFKLDDVLTGRKQFLLNLTFKIQNSDSLLCRHFAQMAEFGTSFDRPLRKAVNKMENNYTDDQVWYRIVAVLGYIMSDITRHKAEYDAIPVENRVSHFVNKYKLQTVLEKMRLHHPPTTKPSKTSRLLNIFPGPSRFGRGDQGSSSAASLTHGRRLGLRQIQMRGLVPLEEAEDGGHYF